MEKTNQVNTVNTFKIDGSLSDFTPLVEPVSEVAGSSIFLVKEHLPQMYVNRHAKFFGRPLSIYGVEIEGGEVTSDSILAFGLKGGNASKSMALKFFAGSETLLATLQGMQ